MEKTQKITIFFLVVLFAWSIALFFIFDGKNSAVSSQVLEMKDSLDQNTNELMLLKQRTFAPEPKEEALSEETKDETKEEEKAVAKNCSTDITKGDETEWLNLIEKEFTAYINASKKAVGSVCKLENGNFVVSAARSSAEDQKGLIAYYSDDKEDVKGGAYDFECPAKEVVTPPLITDINADTVTFECYGKDKTLVYELELGSESAKLVKSVDVQ